MFTTANHLLNAPKIHNLMCKMHKNVLTNSPFHYCSLIHHPGLTQSFAEGLASGLTLNLSKVQKNGRCEV